jgi:hypothetical protein
MARRAYVTLALGWRAFDGTSQGLAFDTFHPPLTGVNNEIGLRHY